MADTVETAIYKIGVEGQAQLDQAAKSADQLAASEDRVTTATEKVTRATRTSAESLERLAAANDKTTRATAQYTRGLEQLKRLEEEEVGTATRRGQVLDFVEGKFRAQLDAIDKTSARLQYLTAKFDPVTASAKAMAAELAELNEAQKLGVEIIGGYANAWDRIVEKYNFTARSARELADEVAALDAQMQSIADREKARTAQLQEMFDPAGASARRMAKEIADLNEAVRRNITIEGGYDAVLQRIIEKYDLGVQAAKRLQAEQQRLIETARQAQAAQDAEHNQQAFSASQGIRPAATGGTGTAGAGAGAIDVGALQEAADNEDRLAASLQKVRDSLNPLLPLQRAHQENVKILDELLGSGLLPLDEYGQALRKTNAEYAQQVAALDTTAEAQRAAAQATKTAAQEQEKLAAAAQRYNDALDPLAANTRALETEIAKINQLNAAGLMTDNQRVASIERINAVYAEQAKTIQAASPQGQAAAKAATDQQNLAASAQHLKDQINPLAAATRSYAAEIAKADELLKAKLITDRDHAAAVTMAKGKLDDFGKSARGSTSDADLLAQTNRRMTATVTNLSFQLNDVVSGIISGQQPLRIMAQQGGQIVQAFQQSPGGAAGALAAFRTFLVGLVTPTTVAVAGLATLGVGLLLVINRAIQLETQLRTFNVILKGFGAEGQTSATGLERMERNLRGIGIAADEAAEALLKVIRIPGVNRGAAESIVRTGAGLGVLTGAGTVNEATKLAQAVADQDVEALIKLGIEYARIDAPTAKFIRDQKEAYGSGVATDQIYAIIAKNMKDVYASSLGTFAKAINDLKNAWDDFLKDAAISGEIQRFVADLKEMLSSIRELIGYIDKIRNLPKTVVNSINESGNEATKKALENQQELINALADRDRESGITPPRSSPLAAPSSVVARVDRSFPDGSASSTVPAPAKKSPEELAAEKATGDQLQKNNDLLNKQTLEYNKLNAARRLYGLSQIEEEARIRGLDEAISKGLTGLAQKAYADRVADQARKERLIDLDKEAKTQAVANDLAIKTGQAYGTSMAAGLRAAAAAQAELDVRAGNAANARARELAILRTAAAESAKSLGEQGAAANNAIAAQERMAAATAKGTSAAKEQEIQNEAIAKTETMLAQATALHDENLRKLALAYQDLFEAQGRAKEAATQTAQAFAEVNRMGRDLQVAQLETAMIGKAPEDVTRAISLLRGAQAIADQYGIAVSKAKDEYAGMVANLANAQVHLAKLREEQERSNRLFQGIASNIESTLGTAIDDIFAGKKIDDWGTRIKTMIGQVQATIAKETFLKPLIGTGLQLFGASPEVTKQYGSFLPNETKDVTGDMVKKWADQLATTPLAVKTMTVEQATINVTNAAKAVEATASPAGPMAPVNPAALTGPLTSNERVLNGRRSDNYGYPFPVQGTTAAFPALPVGPGFAPTSGWGYPTNPTPLSLPANMPPARNAEPNWSAIEKQNMQATDQAIQDEQKLAEARTATSGATKAAAREEVGGGLAYEPGGYGWKPPVPVTGNAPRDMGLGVNANGEPIVNSYGETAAEAARSTNEIRTRLNNIRRENGQPEQPLIKTPVDTGATEQATRSQEQLAAATTKSATAADQAAQATDKQANDNEKLANSSNQTSGATANLEYQVGTVKAGLDQAGSSAATTATELSATNTAMGEVSSGSAAAAGNVSGATAAVKDLGDGAQMVTTDVPLATDATKNLATGAAEAATNLDTQKAATADTSTAASQAADTARSVADGLTSLSGNASSAVPNIQAASNALADSSDKAQTAAAGYQAAANSMVGAANTAAAATTVAGAAAGASAGSLSSALGTAASASNLARGLTSGSGVNIGSLAQGAGFLEKLFGGGSGSSGSIFSQGGAFGNIPNPFSGLFGSSGGGSGGLSGLFNSGLGGLFSTTSKVPISDLIGIEQSTLSPLGLSGSVASTTPGIFGNLSLGGAFQGIGLGFGAGSFLNTLLGGNKTFGSIGSGLGSLAGTLALGPIGGLLGGLFGGALGGLFGNNKPSNASAGGGIDLATGRVTGTFQGGNSSIDQPTLQAIQQLSQGLAVLKTIPGNTLGGNILFQNGVNTGSTVDWSGLTGVDLTAQGLGTSGRMSLGKDPAAAALAVFQTLSHGLTGVSDTVQKIIANTTDLSKLAENLSFAPIYDNIKTAFDSAFQSISTDTQTLGPFASAISNMTETFQQLKDKATEFGLAVEPIIAAQDEAIKRLKADYQQYLAQQETSVQGQQSQFIGTAQAVHQQFIQNVGDANALGVGDAATMNRISAIELSQLAIALGSLDLSQLESAVQTFATTAPEVANFAQALIDAGQYLPDQITQLTLAITDPVTLAIDKERLAGEERVRIAQSTGEDIIAINQYNALALNEIWKQATASLKSLQQELTTGPSSGLTAAEQVQAANDNFARELALVQAGNLSEINNLATVANSLIQVAQQTYGNAPQTATIRQSIIDAIDQVLGATPAFATGTLSTPPGTILVGEKGPELITQPGGMRVWNNPDTERMLAMMPDRHFAEGTQNLGVRLAPSAPSNDDLKGAIAALSDEVRLLRQQSVRVQQVVGDETAKRLDRIAGGVEQGNRPAFEPPARRRA